MDLMSLAAAKNYTNKVAAGVTAARVEGNSIILTLVDGSEAKCTLPAPKDGTNGLDGKDGISVVDLSIDTDGSLLCHMSDGQIIDAGYVPTVDPDLTNYYTKEEVGKLENLSTEDKTNLVTAINEVVTKLENMSAEGVYVVTEDQDISYQGKPGLYVNGGDTTVSLCLGSSTTGGTHVSLLSGESMLYLKTSPRVGLKFAHNGFTFYTCEPSAKNMQYNSFSKSALMTTDTDQTISGIKTFSKAPKTSITPTMDTQLTNKKYVDDAIAAAITSALEGEY